MRVIGRRVLKIYYNGGIKGSLDDYLMTFLSRYHPELYYQYVNGNYELYTYSDLEKVVAKQQQIEKNFTAFRNIDYFKFYKNFKVLDFKSAMFNNDIMFNY